MISHTKKTNQKIQIFQVQQSRAQLELEMDDALKQIEHSNELAEQRNIEREKLIEEQQPECEKVEEDLVVLLKELDEKRAFLRELERKR